MSTRITITDAATHRGGAKFPDDQKTNAKSCDDRIKKSVSICNSNGQAYVSFHFLTHGVWMFMHHSVYAAPANYYYYYYYYCICTSLMASFPGQPG